MGQPFLKVAALEPEPAAVLGLKDAEQQPGDEIRRFGKTDLAPSRAFITSASMLFNVRARLARARTE